MAWGKGAIVVKKPPSIWHYISAGLGRGITQGVEMALREKERKRYKVDSWYEGILSGKMDPRITGTQQFIDYTKKMGIYDDPAMQTMFQAGHKAWGKPEMGPPEQKTIMDFRNTLAEEERRRTRQKELDKVEIFELKENIKQLVEREYQLTPEQQLDLWKKIDDKATALGISDRIKSQSVKIGGTTTTIAGAYDVLQDKIRVGEKADTEFFKLHKEVGEDRTGITQAIARIGAGQKPSTLTALIDFMAKDKGISIEKMDGLKPDDQIRMIVKAFNDEYKIKHDRLRKLAPGARQKVPKFKPLNAEAFIKGEVEEIYKPRESFKPEEARDKIMPPTEDPREETIQDAMADIHLNFENLKTMYPSYTKADLIDHLKAEREGIIDQYGLTLNEFETIIKRIEEGK